MTAYYNENEPHAAQWLRNLIESGLIARGVVDTRSIVDVRASDLAGFTQCHFFAGIGGWSLAARLAGWSDDHPLWTGSCPCQPFSLAGSRKGFDDARHLWPEFRRLIGERRPAVVFGEQVASASAWLGLVRGDLEALEYAVGAMPIEAASAGADHLRDRYWFVGDDTRDGRREGWSEYAIRSGRPAVTSNGGLGDSSASRLPLPEREAVCGAGRRDERRATSEPSGALDGSFMADSDLARSGQGREQRSGQQCGACRDPQACSCGRSGTLPDAERSMCDGRTNITLGGSQTRSAVDRARGEHGSLAMVHGAQFGEREPSDAVDAVATRGEARSMSGGTGFAWVIGADGKARRVKPGIRLLANGIPGRVGKLRGFGNAIDPRPAAEFIGAYLDRERA